MAAVSGKLKGSAPKVRNRNRGPGYWVGLAKSRDNRDRELPKRDSRQGINFPYLDQVGSAAYRRMQKHKPGGGKASTEGHSPTNYGKTSPDVSPDYR